MKRKVMIVDDHKLVLNGIKMFVESIEGYEVVGTASNGSDALRKVAQLHPDIILLDYGLPDCNGIDLTEKLLKTDPALKIIILTSYVETELVVAANKAGAMSYLTKNIDMPTLKHILDETFESNNFWLDPNITRKLLSSCERIKTEHEESLLKEDERIIVAHVVDGKSNREIANEMHLTEQTVKNYLSSIFKKLGVNNRAEVAVLAVRHKLI